MSTAPVKAVIDCSQTGALDAETRETLAASFREAALGALERNDLESATAAMKNAQDVLAAPIAATAQLVELDKDELQQLAADQAEHAEVIAAMRAGRLGDLVALCDRYLALTDWIMAPSAARPVDMSANLAKACDKNADAWKAWRADVRKIRDAAATGTADPDSPGFPDQPAAPKVAFA